MEEAASISHAGLTAFIYQDIDIEPMSPRDADNLGILAFEPDTELECGLSETTVGDAELSDPVKQCPVCDGFGYLNRVGEDTDCQNCEATGEVEATLDEFMAETHDAAVVIPLRFVDYRSGGASVYEEDHEPNGVIFIPASKLDQEGLTVEQGRKNLEAEIEELDMWLQGEAWGYVVKHEDGSEINPPQFGDSCWGFLARFGRGDSWEDFLSYCRNACEDVREELDQEAAERSEWAARDVETEAI